MSLLIADSISTTSNVEFIQLRHPGYPDSSAVFALARDGENGNYSTECMLLELHEATTGSESSSAFVGNTVRKSTVLFLLTSMDVHLIMATLLDQQNGRTVPIPQLLRVEGFPHYEKLTECKGLQWNLIADVDDSDKDMILVGLNENKFLMYLLAKVERTAEHLRRNELSKLECGGTTSGFNGPATTSTGDSEVRKNVLLKESERLAIQIISEYLPQRWKERLAEARCWTIKQIQSTESFKHSNDSPLTNAGDTETFVEGEPKGQVTWEEAHGYAVQMPSVDHLRFGTRQHSSVAGATIPVASSTVSMEENMNKRLKPNSVPMTSAQKKLAQVKDKRGVQSISSFFGKKGE